MTGGDGRRVALLAPCYWPEVRRGTERFTRDLADGLVARGHRPRLITSHPGLPSRAVEDGLEVIRMPRPPDSRLIRRKYEDYLTHGPLSAAALRLTRNDIAHALYATDAIVAARWSRRSRRPSVFSYMGIPNRAWLVNRRLRVSTTVEAATGADAVVALSRTAADEFQRTLGVRARVIAPGVDTETFTPGGSRAEVPTIFCAASITTPAKLVGQLIEAFALVRRDRPDARLKLSAPGDRRAGEAMIAGHEGVELVDVDDRAALVEAYQEAWLSCLPSMGEAFGLVLVESLACGTPVVGRRHSAIPEVLEGDGIGGLFEGGPDELSQALLEGLELAGDRATVGACRARAEEFSREVCTSRYQELYTELLQARGV